MHHANLLLPKLAKPQTEFNFADEIGHPTHKTGTSCPRLYSSLQNWPLFSTGTNIKRESPNTYALHLKTDEGQLRNIMAVSFQFAFLGPNNKYSAAVTN
jgi:hypothetical protein